MTDDDLDFDPCDTVTCEVCAPCGCDIADQGPDPARAVVLHDENCRALAALEDR